jgi:hypothetical protein
MKIPPTNIVELLSPVVCNSGYGVVEGVRNMLVSMLKPL